jgi:hypothetical protein
MGGKERGAVGLMDRLQIYCRCSFVFLLQAHTIVCTWKVGILTRWDGSEGDGCCGVDGRVANVCLYTVCVSFKNAKQSVPVRLVFLQDGMGVKETGAVGLMGELPMYVYIIYFYP